ncbi:hypothetical protein FKM82_028759 [Ascaphus truei]
MSHDPAASFDAGAGEEGESRHLGAGIKLCAPLPLRRFSSLQTSESWKVIIPLFKVLISSLLRFVGGPDLSMTVLSAELSDLPQPCPIY